MALPSVLDNIKADHEPSAHALHAIRGFAWTAQARCRVDTACVTCCDLPRTVQGGVTSRERRMWSLWRVMAPSHGGPFGLPALERYDAGARRASPWSTGWSRWVRTRARL